jgi:hypothetical protein
MLVWWVYHPRDVFIDEDYGLYSEPLYELGEHMMFLA